MPYEFMPPSKLTPHYTTGTDPVGADAHVTLHSPIEVVGAFVYILRDYFQTDGLLWTWTDNKNTTDIVIESGNEEEIALANAKPGIFVNRGQTIYEQISVGDLDQDQPQMLEKRVKHFLAYGKTSISVECISPRHGESALLGDLVQQFLQMSSNEIQAYFHFQNMGHVVLNATQPFEKDEKFFNTPAMFQLGYEVRWGTVPIAPSLKNLSLKLTDSQADPLTFFRNIVLK